MHNIENRIELLSICIRYLTRSILYSFTLFFVKSYKIITAAVENRMKSADGERRNFRLNHQNNRSIEREHTE